MKRIKIETKNLYTRFDGERVEKVKADSLFILLLFKKNGSAYTSKNITSSRMQISRFIITSYMRSNGASSAFSGDAICYTTRNKIANSSTLHITHGRRRVNNMTVVARQLWAHLKKYRRKKLGPCFSVKIKFALLHLKWPRLN